MPAVYESVPVQLNSTKFLDLGKATAPNDELKELLVREFHITGGFSSPTKIQFVVVKESFAKGGFREAYRAKQIGESFLARTSL